MQAVPSKKKALVLFDRAFWDAHAPSRWEYIVAALVMAFCYLAFAHVDIIETANHTWLFLDNLFSGNFMHFYENVYAHENALYYVNAAHYNVFVYAVFGLWELPVYLVCKIAGILPNPAFLYLWAKLVSCFFALGCGVLLAKLAMRMGVDKGLGKWTALLFLLSPVTLFSVFSMGQYDTLCLFFTLLALLLYFDRRFTAFALVMGIAIVCKFFALLLLVPLLLLAEKRFLFLLKYALISLWLYLPTALLFAGRDGDMGFFTKLMTERMFVIGIPGGITDPPLFFIAFALIAAFCYFYQPADDIRWQRMSVYVCMAVFCTLFFCIVWHPQWLVLLVPFFVLSTVTAQNKTPWFWIDLFFCAGFFLLTYVNYPGQLEANLFDAGLLGLCSGQLVALTEGYRVLSFYFGLIPYMNELSPVLFAAPMFASILWKAPYGGVALCDRLTPGLTTSPSMRAGLWGVCTAGFGGFFLLPCIFEWLKCFGLL